MTQLCNFPLAAPGLVSYRCKAPYGWIMIGATDADDAYREAKRSNPRIQREDLQVWNGEVYADVISTQDKEIRQGSI